MYNPEDIFNRNQICLTNPELGDYWHVPNELFSPILVVVKVTDGLIACFKGLAPYDCRMTPGELLLDKHLSILTQEEFDKLVKNETKEEFIADCYRNDGFRAKNEEDIKLYLEKAKKFRLHVSPILPLIDKVLEAYKANNQ